MRKIDWPIAFATVALAAVLIAIIVTNDTQQAHYTAANTDQASDQDYPWWQYSGTWVAIFTVVLTASTALLWWTTRETLRHAQADAARQARDMQASIATAQEANKLSRDIFAAADRPYCVLINFRIEAPDLIAIRTMDLQGRTNASVVFTVRHDLFNAGTRPALCSATAFRPDISLLPVKPLDPLQIPFEGLSVVSQGETIPGNTIELVMKGTEAIAIVDQLAILFISGFVCYRDTHQVSRRTGFIYRYVGDSPNGASACGPAAYWFDVEDENKTPSAAA